MDHAKRAFLFDLDKPRDQSLTTDLAGAGIPLRDLGVTYTSPPWIWSPGVANALYARPGNGRVNAAIRQSGTAAKGPHDQPSRPLHRESNAARAQLKMWPRLSLVILVMSAVIVCAALYVIYRLVDPLPPRHLVIAAGMPGSGYENIAKRYGKILARHGVELEIRNSAGAVEDLNLLRDPTSGVKAALTTFGVTQPADQDILYSLGGIFDAAIFIFYRGTEPITMFAQLRGKRIAIGMPGTALRLLMLDVLNATGAMDSSITLVDLDYTASVDALLSGRVDVAIIPAMESGERTLIAPGIQLMSVAQAEAIAKTVPGLKHVVLWRGLIDLNQDIPKSDVDLLASRNRLLVRNELHPALQYLLLEAMREVHSAPGPFNRLGEFPAEQPNDLPLSATAEAFYRSAPLFWQRYTSFWVSSLVNRLVFFVLPVVAAMIPIIGFGLSFYRWLHTRRVRKNEPQS
jgi:TRAP-type uncharacterized transport system substrate-binding protein